MSFQPTTERGTERHQVRPVGVGEGELDHLLRELERAQRRLAEHPEIDGQGIERALEHDWAVMDLLKAGMPDPATPSIDPQERLAG